MANVSLLNRVDTRYLTGLSRPESILSHLMQQYRMLSIHQVHLNHYQTLYFDTSDLVLYRQHHNGIGSRYKVRARRYVESNQAFFEVKHKTNQDRTIKTRLPIPALPAQIHESISAFVNFVTILADEQHIYPQHTPTYSQRGLKRTAFVGVPQPFLAMLPE